ncbi:alkanesulfonate monooxygenase SsuD/methylene tetrahydromethanopterin reductase-like flavin-dependent oxidoreductase (luciferase family) [Humitalea rosea]|uniref:Alkanesulfonate monooxygenase SsuD/methylene tetrahydromethanopterin reductase-like flavin-dependent oxidoreductase (Luciferase family) n=1 Tax=Humitalea rosea TaxID=990373 RepID=A0A2W7HWF7_9PROT|nr:LLM class flavin-dependent oxidoreductase [Humitalea rosea]PZW37685.1 alkanesulfonate monooxygenase SsuD/methylene tetrahydromethanopterin reductase-like flavin-dependent oxidoreductase (luciferase family) [Humitalea rosea]
MRFSNFLFPESRSPATDGAILDEVMQEIRLSEHLNFDAVWLGEHHFDGNCCYVDPITFSAAVAMATSRIRIGYAVAQTSLHHPIRLAEQLALIDHLSKGRLIVGLGRGTNYNVYDYEGFGIDPAEAQARFEEAEDIMLRAWTGEPLDHDGRFWQLKVPALRPGCYTRPHPFVIRSASGEASMVALAKQARPFLMSVQTNAVTRQRLSLYRQTMAGAGADEAGIAKVLDQCWAWRNVYVAGTDAEAEAVGIPAFIAMHEQRAAMRNRIAQERAVGMGQERPGMGNRIDPAQGLVCGSPATVAEQMSELAETGIGGVIITFRLGAMPYEVASESIRLFMSKVVPQMARPLAA